MRTDLAVDPCVVTADRVQLQQVLMNLMLNGIEAMTDSGGELTVSSRLAQDGQLTISVSDTGVGLPTEQPESDLCDVLQHQAPGQRDGVVDQPFHRRIARRAPVGDSQHRPRRDVSLHIAGRPHEPVGCGIGRVASMIGGNDHDSNAAAARRVEGVHHR